jgi:hypothetical protein
VKMEKPKPKPVKLAAAAATTTTTTQLLPFIGSAAWTGPKRGYALPQLTRAERAYSVSSSATHWRHRGRRWSRQRGGV